MRVEDQFLYLYFLLRSPVMNGSVNAWLVHLSGYVSIDGVYGSYGCICSTDYSKFFQNYWWLRSPTTDPIYVYGAYYVTPDGDVGLGGYSVPATTATTISVVPTGEKSPVPGYSSGVCYVFPDGDVLTNYYGVDTSSYGRILRVLLQI